MNLNRFSRILMWMERANDFGLIKGVFVGLTFEAVVGLLMFVGIRLLR